MQIHTNAQLQGYNTFSIASNAEFLLTISSLEDLGSIVYSSFPIHVLGGGSNILLCGNMKGFVLKNDYKGITIIEETDDFVEVEVCSGENWHEWVMRAVGEGWGGIENLALIPGTVGAAPIQNIGAYGVEVKDVITEVEYYDFANMKLHTLKKNKCGFGYRTSVFKTQMQGGSFFITKVFFKLSKKNVANIGYGALGAELSSNGIESPTIADVANAVMAIRRSKLPDPRVLGNAGSFFKNPVIPASQFADLRMRFPNMPSYPTGDAGVKVPAGWLIEAAGLKGYRNGNVGVHALQALVIVNYGGASGKEILACSKYVQHAVFGKFGITLEREVQIWE